MTIFLYANNAKSALAGSITNVATNANLTPGSGVLFPAPTSGQQFALTFTDQATGLLREIVYVTSRTGDSITMVRGQEGTTALAWSAGDIAASLLTAGNMTAAIQPGQTNYTRIRLLANQTFYYSPTGNDSTGDGTSLNPWATIQFAMNFVYTNYDVNGFKVTFLSTSASATYNQTAIMPGLLVGQPSSTDAVVVDLALSTLNGTGVGIGVVNGANIMVQNANLKGAAGCNVLQASRGNIQIGSGISFDASPGATHISIGAGGLVSALNNYTIKGGADYHWAGTGNSLASFSGRTVTITGTPSFGALFCFSEWCSVVLCSGMTFVGSATGTRYNANMNGVIDTNGAGPNYLPGNAAGSITLGGQYN